MGIVALVAILPVAAQQQGPSAERSLSSTTVDAGGTLTVTLQFANAGLGRLTETLPAGFTYVSSNLPDNQVVVSGQTVGFRLFQVTSPITYTVTAASTAGEYDFSGTLRSGPQHGSSGHGHQPRDGGGQCYCADADARARANGRANDDERHAELVGDDGDGRR